MYDFLYTNICISIYSCVSCTSVSISAQHSSCVYSLCQDTFICAAKRMIGWGSFIRLLAIVDFLLFHNTHTRRRSIGRSIDVSERERERPNSICVYLELADACGEPKQFADFMLDHTNIVHLAIRCSNIFSQHNVLTIRYHHSRRTSYQSPHIISVTNATKKKKNKETEKVSEWGAMLTIQTRCDCLNICAWHSREVGKRRTKILPVSLHRISSMDLLGSLVGVL